MCSFFWQRMEKDQGDLTDIIRATGGNNTNNPLFDWQFPSEPTSFPVEIEEPVDDFCDPFSNMRDPLLHELGFAGSALFDSSNTIGMVKMNVEGDDSVSGNLLVQKRPCNIFTRMVQISPNAKNSVSDLDSPSSSTTRGIKPSSLVVDGMVNGEAQISLPRNTGMKRRKNQAKKVVCIPAPTAANSRPGGEIVPSDLWAWRKYGQKPIKGSPYPRGYYRCSSSKGCPARKQVERSRTDPNMLVITYSSEHNHSWPTQRNALAGSTRSQPMRSNVHSKSSPTSNTQIPTKIKEEHKKKDNSMLPITTERSITSPYVKEEMGELEKPTDIDDHELDNSFNQIYRPTLPDSIRSDDFFADFGELETDPLNIMFSQGFASHKLDEDRDNKALDPFNLLDPLIWRN